MTTKRLIDANDALERLKKAEQGMVVVSMVGCKAVPMHGVIEFIKTRPTVDAVEVVHGEWVQIGYDKAMDRISCSCCKEYWNILDNDTDTFNYCPNCGAKMDGGVKNA